jgi:hypothetical protein
MGIGAIVGWIISVILPPEKVEKLANRVFHRNAEELSTGDKDGDKNPNDTTQRQLSIQELNQTDPVARLLSRIFLIAAASLILLILVYLLAI